MPDLSSLIARVESGPGEDRELDGDIAEALELPPKGTSRTRHPISGVVTFTAGLRYGWDAPPLTCSLDAVVALAERLLPKWNWYVYRNGSAEMIEYGRSGRTTHGTGKPARALLAALLRAVAEPAREA